VSVPQELEEGAGGPLRGSEPGFAWEESVGRLVEAALAEDVGAGDWTTLWTVAPEARGVADVVAKGEMIVAGGDVAVEVFRRVDRDIAANPLARDGQKVKPGDVVLRLEGPLRGILTGERTALNFLGAVVGGGDPDSSFR
jgi:nicotinate-nucleotide pyrophosphorylase (carboxylating)